MARSWIYHNRLSSNIDSLEGRQDSTLADWKIATGNLPITILVHVQARKKPDKRPTLFVAVLSVLSSEHMAAAYISVIAAEQHFWYSRSI